MELNTEARADEARTLTFDAVRLPILREEVARLNKLAAKLGVDPIVVDVVERTTVKRTQEDPFARYLGEAARGCLVMDNTTGKPALFDVEVVTVTITGESPTLPGGWRYVGAIEHNIGGGEANLVHGDAVELAEYRDAPANCDHCKFRRNRKKTVILRSDDDSWHVGGAIVQVGSTCLKDFLGYHGNPERVIDLVDSLRTLSDDFDGEGGWGSSYKDVPVDLFLTTVAAIVRGVGWVSKAQSSFGGKIPTAILAEWALGFNGAPKPATGRESRDQAVIDDLNKIGRITDADHAEGQAVKAWALTIDPGTTDNYLGNVRTVLAGNFVEARHFGIAASAVSARRREIERTEAKAVAAGLRKASEHVGTVGERRNFDVEVTFVRAFPGFAYNSPDKVLVSMVDGDGNILKTWNSGQFGADAEKGQKGTIKATVKEHGVYNEAKENHAHASRRRRVGGSHRTACVRRRDRSRLFEV